MAVPDKSDLAAKVYRPDLQKIRAGKSRMKVFNIIPSKIFENSQSVINAAKAGVWEDESLSLDWLSSPVPALGG